MPAIEKRVSKKLANLIDQLNAMRKDKDAIIAQKDIEIKNLRAGLLNIQENVLKMPEVKELKHSKELAEDENRQLKEIIEKQKDKLFTSAAEVAKSQKRVLMNKKYIGSVFAINSNNGRARDFDIELIVEGDRVAGVLPQAVNVVKIEQELKH